MRSPRVTLGALWVVLVLTAVAFGILPNPEGGSQRVPTRLAAAGSPVAGPFTISGSVTGLYPGAITPLLLSLHNTNPYPLVVTDVSVTAVNTDHSGCVASTVTSPGFHGSFSLGPSATAALPVTISMSNTTTDACQNATFALTFSGQAERRPLPTEVLVGTRNIEVHLLQLGGTVQLAADLRVAQTSDPVVGRTITFRINNAPVCQGVTGPSGRANCTATLDLLTALLAREYQAGFAPDSEYLGSSNTASLTRYVFVL